MFGMLESQFRKTFQEAERVSGITGENLLIHLERRLDNIVYRLGFASSRSEARQLVGHGRVRVNGRRVSIPSFPISTGHVVELELKCRQWPKVAASLEGMQRRGLPEWLDLNREEFRGTVKYLPRRSDLTTSINEKLIVELYSK
jgi:small subunit ribosomal protein S4